MIPEKRKQKKKTGRNRRWFSLFSYFRLYLSLLAKRQKTQKSFVSRAFNDDDTPLVTNILCVCTFIETS